MSEVDARALNWRFVVPDEPEGLLLLPSADEAPRGAVVAPPSAPAALSSILDQGRFPAVVVPDLMRWARLTREGKPIALLARLAEAVVDGGWLCVGVSNPWYPGNAFSSTRLRPARAKQLLLADGFRSVEAYLALPDLRCPAYLVGSDSGRELDHLMRHLFLPYVGSSRGLRSAVKVVGVRVMRRVALWLPVGVRTRFAPAVLFVAKRSAT
jgi:hypothetical protein